MFSKKNSSLKNNVTFILFPHYTGSLILRKIVLSAFLVCCFVFDKAQSSSAFGVGLNSALFFSTGYYHYPSLPVSPYINARFNRHEWLAGADLFPMLNNKTIAGVQLAYRYHFLNPRRAANLFVDLNVQGTRYLSGCGEPLPYYSTDYSFCFDGALFRNSSAFGTAGLGIEIQFLKRFSIYAIGSAGVNYYYSEVFRNWSGYDLQDISKILPIASLKAGLSFNIIQRKKNACDACPK